MDKLEKLEKLEKIDDDIVKDEQTENKYIFNPYNVLNQEISLYQVQAILTKYGVPGKVNNFDLYKRAFIHHSMIKRDFLKNTEFPNLIISPRPPTCIPLKSKSNERVEFLGDGVLELAVKYYLYKRFPNENEGFMTEKKIALVKNETIGKFAYEIGLHKWYILSRGSEEKKIRTNHKKLGCLFEAFIGSLFLDYNKININDEDKWFSNTFVTGPGFQAAQIFIENVLENHVDWSDLIHKDDNFKNKLQVILQKEFKITPEYIENSHDEDGYEMFVYLCIGQKIYEANQSQALDIKEFNQFSDIHEYVEKNNKILVFLGKSLHKIKKKAEQDACASALEQNLFL